MQDNLIEQQVDIHDKTQFEIKFDYDQDLSLKKNCYRVEAFFFFPQSLRIDKHHYSKKTFYQDLKTNIRIRTPQVALNKLVDNDSEASLQSRIKEPFNRLLSGGSNKDDITTIKYELKLFAAIFRSQIGAQVSHLLSLVDQLNGKPDRYTTICSDIAKLLKIFVKDINNAIGTFRKLRAKFLNPTIPSKLIVIFEEINEFLSLTTEIYLSRLLLKINATPPLGERLNNSYEKLRQLIKKESKYRAGANYLSSNPKYYEGEKFIYRNGELKKTITEVLFLKPKIEKEGGRAAQFAAMIAAGLAMFWALTAVVFGQNVFIVNSTPFLVMMILAYIVKDRIKDSIKKILDKKLFSKLFHDRKIAIHDYKLDKKVGHVRETFMYVDKQQVPDDVLKMRYPALSGKRFETIIKHHRVITLFTKKFEPSRSRISNVTRLCVSNFLSKMDDPLVLMPCYVEEDQTVKQIPMSKVYHIHLILRMLPRNKKKSQPILKHFRIVLNKEGIKRLETLAEDSSIKHVHYCPTIVTDPIIEDESFSD